MCSHLKRSDNSSKFPKNNLRSKFPKYFSCFPLFIILPPLHNTSSSSDWECEKLADVQCTAGADIALMGSILLFCPLNCHKGGGDRADSTEKGKTPFVSFVSAKLPPSSSCMCSGEFRTGQQRPINSVNVSRSHKFHHLGASSAENEHRGQVGGDL